MKRVGISGRLVIIIVCGAVMMACNTGLPDVLVTKSGTRYQGQVADKGNSYVLIKRGGGKIGYTPVPCDTVTGGWQNGHQVPMCVRAGH